MVGCYHSGTDNEGRKDRATQPMDHGWLRWATDWMYSWWSTPQIWRKKSFRPSWKKSGRLKSEVNVSSHDYRRKSCSAPTRFETPLNLLWNMKYENNHEVMKFTSLWNSNLSGSSTALKPFWSETLTYTARNTVWDVTTKWLFVGIRPNTNHSRRPLVTLLPLAIWIYLDTKSYKQRICLPLMTHLCVCGLLASCYKSRLLSEARSSPTTEGQMRGRFPCGPRFINFCIIITLSWINNEFGLHYFGSLMSLDQ